MLPQPYSQSYLDAAHLLRAAGFGGTPDEIQAAVQQGLPAATQSLLNYEAFPDDVSDDAVIEKLKEALPDAAAQAIADLRLPIRLLQIWWLYRMIATQRPLQEKMVLFWHNHFTSKDGNGRGDLMLRQNQLYRKHALGNFRELTLDVTKDPEMLQYLNGAQNFKAHANENYPRELMELFTCGRVDQYGKPNYTEDDVKASAKAFSGWNFRADNFFWNPNQHDNSIKTFMGHTGNLNGDDIVDILVALPATAYFICHKLFRYFAYDDPEPAVMDALVNTYFDSGYEIRPVVEQILTSNAFYSEKARGGVVKQPAAFAVGTVHMLGLGPSFAPDPQYLFSDAPGQVVPDLPQQRRFRAFAGKNHHGLYSPIGRLAYMATATRDMGQDLFGPPTVKGWDGDAMWLNTGTLQARSRFAEVISSLPDLDLADLSAVDGTNLRQASFTGSGISVDQAQQMVQTTLVQLGPLQVPDTVKQALIEYAMQEKDPETCMRGLISLTMGTAAYQFS